MTPHCDPYANVCVTPSPGPSDILPATGVDNRLDIILYIAMGAILLGIILWAMFHNHNDRDNDFQIHTWDM